MDRRLTQGQGMRSCLGVLVLALAACTGGGSGRPTRLPRAAHDSSPTPVGTHSIQPNGMEKELALSGGFAYRTYEIQALDPTTHQYTIRLVASGHPDLEVWLVSDLPLRVTDSTLGDPSCVRRPMQTVCEWPYPALEARPPGTWTVHVLKKTNAPSTVKITVLFEAVG